MRISPIFKTGILFAGLTALLVLVGYLINGVGGAVFFLIFSIILNIGSFWFSDKIAIAMSGGREITQKEAPELFNDVSELSKKMNIKLPRIFISPQMQPNAFATGRGPEKGVVCFTQGILQILDREELRGVIAHELAHIKNRDVLLSTIVAVMAGAISSIAQIGLFFGSDSENRNPLVSLLVFIFAPISAMLIQLSISRSREYLADATAAKFTSNPKGLADALVKLENYTQRMPQIESNPALASLYIQNPLRGESIMQLFSTHPSTRKRVEKLLGIDLG